MKRWILGLLVLLGAGRFIYGKLTAATEVDIVRVHAATPLAGGEGSVGYLTKNPLELTAAFSFAVTFVVMLAATNFALDHLGRGGIFGLAALSGIAPVDPFIMGLAQTAGKLTPMKLAVAGVIVAAASNNLAKAVLAFFLSDRKTGSQSFVLLLSLAALGLLPLISIFR